MMPHTHTIYCVSTAVSPITHMAKTEGNEAVIQRQEIMTTGGRRDVPSLTGNMLRSVLARHPSAQYLADRWQLSGRVNKSTLNHLFHGGQVAKGSSTAKQNPKRTAEYFRLFPMGRLLGGCLPDDILEGSLCVDFGVLACRENTAKLASGGTRLATFVPDFDETRDLLGPALRPAEDFVGDYTYYRRNVQTSEPELAAAAEQSGIAEPAGMTDDLNASGERINKDGRAVFAGQCVIPGAVFVHRFYCDRVSDLEVGGLLHAMSLWHAGGGYVGGSRAKGHGRLVTAIHAPTITDAAGLMQQYVDHVEASREEGTAFLRREFEPKSAEKKPAKGKTKKEAIVATPESNG